MLVNAAPYIRYISPKVPIEYMEPLVNQYILYLYTHMPAYVCIRIELVTYLVSCRALFVRTVQQPDGSRARRYRDPATGRNLAAPVGAFFYSFCGFQKGLIGQRAEAGQFQLCQGAHYFSSSSLVSLDRSSFLQADHSAVPKDWATSL